MLAHVKGRAPCLLLIKLGLLSQNWQLSLYHFMNHIATQNHRNRPTPTIKTINDVREEVFKKSGYILSKLSHYTYHQENELLERDRYSGLGSNRLEQDRKSKLNEG